MKLKKFKEKDNKRIGIIVFTLVCILLVSGVILYRTFAIFEVKTNQNVINGEVQSMGDLEFAFYQDDGDEKGNHIVKAAPKKGEGYSLDTSSSYCVDLLNDTQVSTVNWDNERWGPYLSNITTTKTKCYLHFKQIYKEEILNGAIPDLMNGRLVPVRILEEKPTDIKYVEATGGKVVKADVTDSNNPWYKYENKQWANAVILRDGVDDNYSPGQEISESDIESYFVWIPRYSYKLQDEERTFDSYSSAISLGIQSDVKSLYETMRVANEVGNKGASNAFDIEFGSKDKGVSSTLLSKGPSIVHPAFETFDSNGFWVGKFETGYNQNEDGSVMPASAESWSTKKAEVNEEKSTKVIIKPGVYSWRNINVSNAFYTSYNYKRNLESHMMKNTEWGAVAYLTQSQYGRCSDGTCTEVRINNNSNYITGYSAKEEPLVGGSAYNSTDSTTLNHDGENGFNYFNQESRAASTTGNYSGIYDMSGGAWEYVMGVMQGKSDNSKVPASGRSEDINSGFKGPYSYCIENGGTEECNDNTSNTTGKEWPSAKYYDLYDYSTVEGIYNRGILGDATKEMGPFYGISYKNDDPLRAIGSYNADLARMVNSGAPWFERSAANVDGTNAGVNAFSYYTGIELNSNSFRVVLTP